MLPGEGPGTIAHGRQELTTARGLAQVKAAVGVMGWLLEREHEGQRRGGDEPAELVAAMGVNGDPTLIPNLALLKDGRWLRRSNEVVIGSRFGREKQVTIGDTLRLAGRDFTIVGIGRLRGVAGLSADQLVYLDDDAFRERAGLGDVLNVIVIDTDEPAAVRERLIEQSPLAVFSTADLSRLAEASFAERMATAAIMSLLVLGIGALFVSSVLGRSVIERRLEFATLKAIGLPSRTILSVVVLEAITISLLASLVAIGLSLVFGVLINVYLADFYGFESLYTADAGAFLGVFALALATGMIAGLLPARRATRVDPVEILREA
jgi:ABC-type antimicrobial peptide transport system permease subunit